MHLSSLIIWTILTYLPISLLSAGALIITAYHLRYHLALRKHVLSEAAPDPTSAEPISIVICARNEENNLGKNLPHFLNQVYAAPYEVIVVDDASWDNTSDVLSGFMADHPHLKKVTVEPQMKTRAGKKFALMLGIKKARNERLIFSDADCRPQSDRWLEKMAASFSKDIVLGHGAYEKSKGVLGSLIQYDTFQVAALYMSKALVGKAYMGVGRNMGYRRSIYDAFGGFRSQYHIAAGDDDLFVNANATEDNVTICLAKGAQTLSEPSRTWSRWWAQKSRHIGVSAHYSKESKWWLSGYHFGQLAFYIGLAASLAASVAWPLAVGIWSAKTLIQLLIVAPIAERLENKEVVALIPLMEPLLLLLNLLISLRALRAKTVEWK